MTYTKNTWQTGDVITAEKLNNIENGIEGAGSGSGGDSPDIFWVNFSFDSDAGAGVSSTTLDKTYAQIMEAIEDGKVIIANGGNVEGNILTTAVRPEDGADDDLIAFTFVCADVDYTLLPQNPITGLFVQTYTLDSENTLENYSKVVSGQVNE